jgi:hypothetical protein
MARVNNLLWPEDEEGREGSSDDGKDDEEVNAAGRGGRIFMLASVAAGAGWAVLTAAIAHT